MLDNIFDYPGSFLLYLGALGLVPFLALLAQLFPQTHVVRRDGQLCMAHIPNRFWFALSFAVMIAIAGMRGLCGIDTASYRLIFEAFGKGPNEPLAQVILRGREYGYALLNYVVIALGGGCNLVFVLSMLLFSVFFQIGLNGYHEKMSVALAMLGLYSTLFFPSLNVMRQMIAVAIFFCATRSIGERKLPHYLIGILFASSFHASALVCLPMYFVIGNENLRPLLRMLMFVGIAAMCVSISLMSALLGALLEDSSYDKYIATTVEATQKLVTIPLRLPFLVPAFVFRKRLSAHDSRNGMWLVFAVNEMLFAQLGTYDPTFARIAFYFQPSWLVLMPQLVRAMPSKNKQRAMGCYAVLCFCAYWYANTIWKNFGEVLPYDTFF